jgi:hypothetical protein
MLMIDVLIGSPPDRPQIQALKTEALLLYRRILKHPCRIESLISPGGLYLPWQFGRAPVTLIRTSSPKAGFCISIAANTGP